MDNFINITYAQFVDKYVDKFIGLYRTMVRISFILSFYY